MKTIPMISIVCSLILSSCGDYDSSAFKSKSEGIHTQPATRIVSKEKVKKTKVRRTAKLSKKAKVPAGFKTAKSPNGFHPAPIDETILAKYKRLSPDKHGMPKYPHKVRHRVVRTTAYSHQENEPGAPWMKNALGTNLKYGQVRSAAADWSRYPVGTKFKIKGLPHTYVVDDYGSALVGTGTVDIYHPTLRSMRKWGSRKAEITIVQWGDWDRTLAILKGRLKYKHTRKMYYAAKAKVDSGKVAKN